LARNQNQKKSGGQGKNQNRDRNRRQDGAQSRKNGSQKNEAQTSGKEQERPPLNQEVWSDADDEFGGALPSYGSFLKQYENDWDDDWDDDDTPIEKKVAAQRAEKAKAKKKKQVAAKSAAQEKPPAVRDKKQPEKKSPEKKSQERIKPPVHEDERLFNNEDDRGLTLEEIDVTSSETRSEKRKPGDKKQPPQKQESQKQEPMKQVPKDKPISKPAPTTKETVTEPVSARTGAPVEAVSKGGGVSLRVVAAKSEFPHANRRTRAKTEVQRSETRGQSVEKCSESKPKDKVPAPVTPKKEEPKSKSPEVRKESPIESKSPRTESKPQRDELKKDRSSAERKAQSTKVEERGEKVDRHSKSRVSQGDATNIQPETSSHANSIQRRSRRDRPTITSNSTPQTPNPTPQTPNPTPQTPNPTPQTPNSTPQTPNSKLKTPTRAAIEPVDISHEVEGKNKPSGFGNLKLSKVMLASLKAANYHEPSPVQTGLIPDVLAGRDVMGQARTGTGKTAAFVIPILEGLDNYEHGDEPVALILVPTRELAVQVRDEAAKLAKGRKVRIIACYGGKPIGDQIAKLKVGADIVVGTPGRILDLSRRGALKLDSLIWVVLDEADRMLDIGFRPDIEKILRLTPPDRQTLLLSATLPPDVVKLAERYMREPKVIDFSDKQMAVETIDQYYITIDRDRKLQGLICLINEQQPKQAIVFCRTKRGADRVKRQLEGTFGSLDSLHGDMTQGTRDRVMAQFRAGKLQILVATDVVGRGIDVTGISHIINYDIPVFCDDYVHRVGRTGRMGRDGTAFTFVTAEEGQELTRIEMRINQQLKRAELKDFEAVSQIIPTDKEPPKPVFGKSARRVRRAL